MPICGMVRTEMTEGMGNPQRMIDPQDIAEHAMLPVRTHHSCTPAEVTVRNTEPVDSKDFPKA